MSLVTRDVFGVAVTSGHWEDVCEHINDRTAAGERIKLAFLNAHTSNIAARDPAFKAALQDFMVLNDGVGVDIAARWFHGQRFPENLNGTDFVPAFLGCFVGPRRIYLLGGREGVAEAAARKIWESGPQYTCVGVRNGYFQPEDEAAIVAEITAAKPDILLVALGNPAQEMFIARHFEALGVPLAIGVGALLDFLAGRIPRAPALMRRMRLEWVWRLVREPGRLWRRYLLGNSQFLWRVIRKG